MRLKLFLAALAVTLCVAGCADPSSWELSGDVRFVELHESVDLGGEKKASFDYSIRNTGKSKIEGTSFAFSYATDKRKYHSSVVDENSIRSGALVYGHVSVSYVEAAEAGKLESAIIESTQFK